MQGRVIILPLCIIYGCSFLNNCSSLLQAMDVAGINDHEGKCGLEMELLRNSWRFRVKEALEGSEKPTMQQVLELLEEVFPVSMVYWSILKLVAVGKFVRW